MNIKIITVIFLFLLISVPVFAMDFPTIAGFTVGENTTATEFVVYLFNLGIAIGAFIAVIMMVMAGVEWLTSSGNPSKVESAKGKIMNTLLGVAVLFGCYLILNTINSQLTSIKISNLYCENGIITTVKDGSSNNTKRKCIDSNKGEISETIINTVSPWNFPAGYLLKAYTYSESNFKGNITEFICEETTCSGNIAGAKSIYFVEKKPGVYLYDGENLKPTNPAVKGYPLFAASSIPDLSKTNNFDNFTKSIDIVDPVSSDEKRVKYIAIVFNDQNYQGRCAFIAQNISTSLDSTAVSPYYTDKVGNDTISSVIIAKSIIDPSTISKKRGEVIFYNKVNCGKTSDGETVSDIKSCHIEIRDSATGLIDFDSGAGNGGCNKGLTPFDSNEEVMSFEITGAAGLVLSTSKKGEGNENTYCQYFNKSSLGGGTCFSSIINSPIFTIGVLGKKPKSFIILPDN
jgi:hypothetical protein